MRRAGDRACTVASSVVYHRRARSACAAFPCLQMPFPGAREFPAEVAVVMFAIKEGHPAYFLCTSRRGFLFASFFVWKDSDPPGRCSMYTRPTWKMYIWLHLPPTKFKAMLPSNSHGQQGEASSAVERTAEPLSGDRMALPAPIPSGRTKEPSARSASSSSTAHEAARARSASHAVR